MKKILFALLLAPLFFTACKKDDPANEFAINGIHDVNFATAGSNVLALAIVQTSGAQQPVTLTVTGLPAGATADIQPASGTPAFSSAITFSQGTAAAGTYPIHIVGTSSSFTKSYDLNLVVPALNGFVFDGKSYSRSTLMHTVNSFPPYVIASILISSFDNGGGYLQADLGQAWPTTDGTYTYHIGGMANNALNLAFSSNGTSASYDSYDIADTTKTATLKIAAGKFTLQVNDAILGNSSNPSMTKTLVVNASE